MHHGYDSSSACLDDISQCNLQSVCVCICEVSAGCENEHCTVEFRKPEAKRAEMR